MLVYGSVCSGIGAATVAWRPLNWRPAWFAEVLPFPSAVLAHHYPETPNLGDMTKIYDKTTFLKKRMVPRIVPADHIVFQWDVEQDAVNVAGADFPLKPCVPVG